MALRAEPTKLTAFLAGIWTMLGTSSIGWWLHYHSIAGLSGTLILIAVLVVFFYVPVFKFVGGWSGMLLWFLGAALCGLLYTPVLIAVFKRT